MNPASYYTILLASQSPRRADLLQQHGYRFQVKVSSAKEHMPCATTVREKVVENARVKGEDILSELNDSALSATQPTVLCAADTLVVLGERVYGKPANYREAKDMLNELAEKTHKVLTGLFLKELNGTNVFEGLEETEVVLKKMNDTELEKLFAKSDPLDKAGGYGFQDAPEIVKYVKGSHTNVYGLPMELLTNILSSWIP
ncbi:MAG: septum formation protein Maf [Acidobacteria bacterium]|nr:MAG: septum formation protein Maf [Acidobacteriota bacterium]